MGPSKGASTAADGPHATTPRASPLKPRTRPPAWSPARRITTSICACTSNSGTPSLMSPGRAWKPAERAAPEARKLEKLQGKLAQKNEVLAELMQEHVQLKKELGEL